MDGQDCGGFFRQLRFDCAGVDAKCFRIAVREDRLKAIPKNTVSGGMKSEAGKDHFTLKVQRAQSKDKSRGAAGNRDAMLDAKIFRSGFLKFANELGISELTAAQNPADVVQEFIVRKSFRRDDGNTLFKSRATVRNRLKS